MRYFTKLTLFVLTIYMVSCGPSVKVTSSWINKDRDPNRKYTSVFILSMTPNIAAKNIVETDLANAAIAKGYKVYKSSEYFPPEFSKGNITEKDVIIARVRQLGCDAILTSNLVNKESEMRYVPGMNMGMGMGMGGMGMGGMGMGYAPFMGYGMGFGGFYNVMGPMMYSPGYYTTDKTYFIEANIFDVETERLIWSAQSEALNPSTISKFSREYSAVLADKIRRDLIKK